ncbi:MAG TPA: DUF2062 domain-containing protein [Rhodospirillales bacterium]|nr:DUF2062 domain-containing protein [Rhodospirillales bacterium]
MSEGYIQKKFIRPLVNLLKQGMDPSRLSLALTSGAIIGVFPILGIATVVCGGIAAFFRLNHPAIQLANYVVFPMQLVLFFPFLTLEETVTGNSLDEISKTKLVETFNLGFLPAVEELTQYFMLASLGWTLALVPLFAILYFGLKHMISIRLSPKCE